MGTFTLSSSSVIDMGSGSSLLTFSDFTASGGSIDIWNWTGTINMAGGTDQLIFGATFGAQVDLDRFNFYSDNGATLLGVGAVFIGNELVPIIPEASTLLSIAGILGLISFHFRKRIHKRKKN